MWLVVDDAQGGGPTIQPRPDGQPDTGGEAGFLIVRLQLP